MAPLPVVIPLAVAAVLAAVGSFLPRRALDAIALAASTSVLILCIVLMLKTLNGVIVYWFGGWQPAPHSHFPVGICFMIDPLSAALASLVSLLVVASFTFSWSYFESVKALYHVLMLVFLAAMCGLCLTGDLFNMFVWYELMTAAAVALCGYESESSQPLQGALNFAVTNTVGAFLSLCGLALLYAFTGSLNMSELSRTLTANPASRQFAVVAFLFVIAGFLVKCAVFPFHFWLAEAHAVAPTPVCILFSGVMVELGLYAIARIYWLIFAGISPSLHMEIRTTFLFAGAATAILGALYCFGQRHLKRLLAFSTISHVGLMLVGFALLDARALAGTAIYILGHGLIKASLFIGAGILLHRFGSVDEYDIRGQARIILPIGTMMAIGAWGLAGLPPFATFFGEKMIDQVSAESHFWWLSIVVVLTEVLTAGAVLRFTARAFLGWGRGRSITSRGAPHIEMDAETRGGREHVPIFMWMLMALLLVAAALLAIPTSGRAATLRYANQFESAQVYQAAVLQGKNESSAAPESSQAITLLWRQLMVALAMFAVAGASLYPESPKLKLVRPVGVFVARIILPLRLLQSGRVGDYVAWFTLGIAAYGGMLLLLR